MRVATMPADERASAIRPIPLNTATGLRRQKDASGRTMALAALITKNRFRETLEPMLEKRRRSQRLTESGARLIRHKGDQLMCLFTGLDQKGLLRPPGEIDFKSIGNVLSNFDEVNQLNATLLRLYKQSLEKDRRNSALPFADGCGNRYSISEKQLVILWGWAYCSLCEVMKTLMAGLVRFPQRPSGIGEVIMALERVGGLDISYFDFVEPGVRNAFFHLDFGLSRGAISIDGRHQPLTVAELVETTKKIDAIIYPMIAMLRLYVGRKE